MEQNTDEGNSPVIAEVDNSVKFNRRNFFGLAGLALGGYAVSKLPDFLLPDEVITQEDRVWEISDVSMKISLNNRQFRYDVRPHGAAPFTTTLTHGKGGVADMLAPRRLLYEATKTLTDAAYDRNLPIMVPNALRMSFVSTAKNLALKDTDGKSSGSANSVLATLFPFEVVARKLGSMEREKALESVSADAHIGIDMNENSEFDWKIDGTDYRAKGYVVEFVDGEIPEYVSALDNSTNTVAMHTKSWLEFHSKRKIQRSFGVDSAAGISLEHTCPSAWVWKRNNGSWVGIAGAYAGLLSFSYASEVISDRPLTAVERNSLVTITPFVDGREDLNTDQIDFLSDLPEKGFNQWKEKYPEVPHSADTIIFNKNTGTFRFVSKENRKVVLETLGPDQIWMTPGEVFNLDGETSFTGKRRFAEDFDMTANGMMLVPQDNGEYKCRAIVVTDQNKRMSLGQTEELLIKLRTKMEMPAASVFVNWDKHGAGGLYFTE